MKGLWVIICLLAAMNVTAQSDKKSIHKASRNPILVKYRTSYKHIYDGVKEDIPYYERLRARMKDKLSKAKTVKSRQTAKDVLAIFDALIVADKKILGLFDGTSRQLDVEEAMKRVVELDQRLRSLVTIKRKRSWLTFDEYQLYLKRGLRFKKCPKGVLPFARDLWYAPKKER